MNERPFDVTADTVLEGSACTWCGSPIAKACTDRYGHALPTPHAQRWYDYWNDTHDLKEQIPVFEDQKGAFRWIGAE